ncbi:hypothetical protein TrRE_jg12469 [Triparma retinervis]|uniref:Uncharacterized protein n=1 Tax=Triparma retinervis TaxID=2557542 RepID=A0A9W7A905_9STRA|nr:hypothetical protein TrRE_jg12469 [Triparma retinervis]
MSSSSLCLFDLYQYAYTRIKANPTCPIRISTSWPNIDSDQASSPSVLAFITSNLVDKAFKEENGLSIRELALLIDGDFEAMLAMSIRHKDHLDSSSVDDERCMNCGVMTGSVQCHDCGSGEEGHLCNQCCGKFCDC